MFTYIGICAIVAAIIFVVIMYNEVKDDLHNKDNKLNMIELMVHKWKGD